MIKVIASDMDGTLLGNDHKVAPETLKAICDAVDIPVIAIGGISKENVSELAGTGICGIAVISAIFAEKDIKKATEKLKSLTGEMVKA